MNGVISKKVKMNCDERGYLAEMYRSDESLHRPAMSYISFTYPHVTRGPHEHVHQADMFLFMGTFTVTLWDNRKDSPTYKKKKVIETVDGEPHLVVVPPGVVHAYKTHEHSGIVFNMPDKLFKGWGKELEVDEIRHENDETSQFKV